MTKKTVTFWDNDLQLFQQVCKQKRLQFNPETDSIIDKNRELWKLIITETAPSETPQSPNIRSEETEPTQFPSNAEINCKSRIFFENHYYCVHQPPKIVRLNTLEICKVCCALKRGLTETTKRLGSELQQPKKEVYIYARQLAEGSIKKWCQIDKQGYKLFDLSCVKTESDPTKLSGCRHGDCEAQVKDALTVYLTDHKERARV